MNHPGINPPYTLLFFGVMMLIMGLAGTLIGQLPGRFGKVAYRAKDPKQYWSGLALYYLGGIGFIGWYFYKIHSF